MTENFRFQITDDGAINSSPPTRHLNSVPLQNSLHRSWLVSPDFPSLILIAISHDWSPLRWINSDAMGDEAEEDAGELNYEYEWIVSEPGLSTLIH
jgi:hypothetical protein